MILSTIACFHGPDRRILTKQEPRYVSHDERHKCRPIITLHKRRKWRLISKNFQMIIWHICTFAQKKKPLICMSRFIANRTWAKTILFMRIYLSSLDRLSAVTAPSLPAFVSTPSTHNSVSSDVVDQDGQRAKRRESSQERRWDVNALHTLLTPSVCGLSNISNLRWFSSRHLPLSSVQ